MFLSTGVANKRFAIFYPAWLCAWAFSEISGLADYLPLGFSFFPGSQDPFGDFVFFGRRAHLWLVWWEVVGLGGSLYGEFAALSNPSRLPASWGVGFNRLILLFSLNRPAPPPVDFGTKECFAAIAAPHPHPATSFPAGQNKSGSLQSSHSFERIFGLPFYSACLLSAVSTILSSNFIASASLFSRLFQGFQHRASSPTPPMAS